MNFSKLKTEYWDAISTCQLFNGISPEYIDELINSLDGQITEYKKNEIVLEIGRKFSKCGIVLEGTIEVSYDTNQFEKHNVNHFSKGEIFGESLALKGINYSPVQVSAVTNAAVLLIDLRKLTLSKDRCCNACLYNHQLLLNLMSRLAEQNIFSNLKLRILGQKSLRDRIMIYLTHVHADGKDGAVIPFSQTAFAEFLGVNRSALARELGRMQKENILAIDRRRYRVISGK